MATDCADADTLQNCIQAIELLQEMWQSGHKLPTGYGVEVMECRFGGQGTVTGGQLVALTARLCERYRVESKPVWELLSSGPLSIKQFHAAQAAIRDAILRANASSPDTLAALQATLTANAKHLALVHWAKSDYFCQHYPEALEEAQQAADAGGNYDAILAAKAESISHSDTTAAGVSVEEVLKLPERERWLEINRLTTKASQLSEGPERWAIFAVCRLVGIRQYKSLAAAADASRSEVLTDYCRELGLSPAALDHVADYPNEWESEAEKWLASKGRFLSRRCATNKSIVFGLKHKLFVDAATNDGTHEKKLCAQAGGLQGDALAAWLLRESQTRGLTLAEVANAELPDLAALIDATPPKPEAPTEADRATSGKQRKKGTTPGDAKEQCESALLAWHEYRPGRVGKYEPIVRAKLVKLTSRGYPTAFFKQHFGGWRKYLAICRQRAAKLEQVLRALYDGRRLRELGRTGDAATRRADYARAGDDSEAGK